MAATSLRARTEPVSFGRSVLDQSNTLLWRVGPLRVAFCLRVVLTVLFFTAPIWLHREFWLRGDTAYYYHIGVLSDAGAFPFLQYWMEYPPVFPLLMLGLYRALAVLHAQDQATFGLAYQVLMSIVDLASLILLHQIVLRVYGARSAATAALVYATSPLVLYVAFGWFDPLAAWFLLAGLRMLLDKRLLLAGGIVGLGVLVKIFPGVLILAAPLLLSWRQTLRFSAAAAAAIALVLLPLVIFRGDLLLASFASMVTREPWETLPALLAGNYNWGEVTLDRFVTLTSSAAVGSTSGPLSLLVQAGACLFALGGAASALRRPRDARRACLVASLGVAAFLLGSKGFSPQFAAWLVPMILLAFPDRRGLVYILLLTACMVAYEVFVHPAMKAYFAFGIGSIDTVAQRVWPYVVFRTLLLSVLTAHVLAATISSARPMVQLGNQGTAMGLSQSGGHF